MQANIRSKNNDEIFEWLCLYLVEGLGNVGAHCLLKTFGNPATIFSAKQKELAEVRELNQGALRNIVDKKFSIDPQKEMKRVDEVGGRIIPFNSTEYPRYLKEIHDPPIILYAKGLPIPSDLPFVAIVGSRNPTHYGRKVAAQLGKDIAEAGVGVVSGMARGIDSAAQWGCIKGKGFSIGVIGTGLDVIYPAVNRKLFENVWEQGVVISEFPMKTPPEPRNFPIRNRLISGISRGVVVVEATKKSGSLITASQALDQGREVFAVPGSIFSGRSAGTHYLIKQGAKLVETVRDILEEIVPKATLNLRVGDQPYSETVPAMSEIEERVYASLSDYPKHIDVLVRELDLDAGQLSGILLNMELVGLVKQLPGKMFVRV